MFLFRCLGQSFCEFFEYFTILHGTMDNPEEVLHCLDEFSKFKPKDIPRELEDYLMYVAKTGDPVYQWPVVKCLFREKLLNVITEFYETTPTSDLPQSPNVDPFNYETMKSVLLERLEAFSNAPFTVQRLCELLTTPRKEYNRPDKFMRAIEKNILVVSTREPGGACRPDSALSEPLPNGVSESAEPTVNPTLNEAFVIEEGRSAVLKESIENHVPSVSSDHSNHNVDTEQSGLSSLVNETSEVTVDVEAKDNLKKEESTESVSVPAVEEPIQCLEEAEKPSVETPSAALSNEDDSTSSTEEVSLSSTSLDTEVVESEESQEKLEDPLVQLLEIPVSEPALTDDSASVSSPSTSTSDSETKLDDTKEELLESRKPEIVTEPTESGKVLESIKPVVTEPHSQPQVDADKEIVLKTLEESEPVLEQGTSEATLNEAADLADTEVKLVEKDAEVTNLQEGSICVVESKKQAVISENIEDTVQQAVTSARGSEESVSIDQALEEAMDVDESSNQLADTEAMAVAEESEPMDDSDQSPTEEMTVCPSLPSQD